MLGFLYNIACRFLNNLLLNANTHARLTAKLARGWQVA